MTSPLKPWETNSESQFNSSDQAQRRDAVNAVHPITSVMPPVYRTLDVSPPVPPSLNDTLQMYGPTPGYQYSGLGSFGGCTGFGGYGTYGGYGGFNNGFPFNNTFTNSPESRLIQLAENSFRPAFQSIESIVQAFGSVTFMVDATYNALYSSFRAALGVADNVGRLRGVFKETIRSVVRWIKWFFKKILVFLRLKKKTRDCEDTQENSPGLEGQGDDELNNNNSSAPQQSNGLLLLFLGIMISGPYLLWKLISSPNITRNNVYESKFWYKSSEVPQYALAVHPFKAEISQEVSFSSGDILKLAPEKYQSHKSQGWLLAENGKGDVGFVPGSHIQLVKLLKVTA